VSIDATKRTRGDRGDLANVRIIVDDRAGRVDVRTEHSARSDHGWVDYTVTVPSGATLELHSISGNLKVSNVLGPVRLESVSGNVTTSGVPRVELAKSASGNVDLTGTSVDGELSASSLSGNVHARGVKARSLLLGSVSGDVVVTDVTCDRIEVKSVSGNVEVSGTLSRAGRYDLTSHSGNLRLILSGNTGFELDASTFSGDIRSDVPLTVGGDDTSRNGRRRGINNRSMRATFGDGSAILNMRTFSGNIVIAKR